MARCGDGWLAFNLPVDEAPARVARLKQLTREAGRDPEALRISTAIFTWTQLDELERYRDAGITEFLLFKSCELSTDHDTMLGEIEAAARRYVDLAAGL